MIDISKLTDEELAALNYGMERLCDNIYENNFTESFEKVAEQLLKVLTFDYNDRQLHYTRLSKKEEE